MGFTTGFTGGVTVTLGIAYLTVLAHERNRQAQAQNLRSQSRVLNGLLEPLPLPPPRSRAELAREERSTLTETAKDRWNEEVENAVRWVQRTDWNKLREGVEGAVSRLLAGGLQKSQDSFEEAGKKVGPTVQEAVDRSKAAAQSAAQEAAGTLQNSGGAVDAARTAVRDVFSKGIEKGKEAMGKAQAAVGMTAEAVESTAVSPTLGDSSAVERALHERYEKPDGLNKSVEEALEERYKPMDSRDNTVLRGV